jgi:hypothetical protein
VADLKILDSYDWREAFGYAGEPGTNGRANVEAAAPGVAVALDAFTIADVEELIGVSEGENDGPAWLAWGRLSDGRWFLLRAGCDYTGWDCQAFGVAIVADTAANMIRFGFEPEDCSRLGVSR